VASFCTWVDDFYRELCKVSNCTKTEAWDLTSKCSKHFFEELREVRSIAANANTERNPIRKSARYLWAVLQSQQVMHNFTLKGFRDHPAIVPVINFHLVQTTASKVSVEMFVADTMANLKIIDVWCNQIDALQAKIQKLSSPSTPKDSKRDGGGVTPKPN